LELLGKVATTASSQQGRGLTQPELCHGHDGVRAVFMGGFVRVSKNMQPD